VSIRQSERQLRLTTDAAMDRSTATPERGRQLGLRQNV
jgi:hypothetical protein